ncbi:5-methylcytosine restriction system specificity protein McrC [Clostridium sp. CTA-1]
MLAYAFKVLNEGSYARLSLEAFNNASELFSAILAKGISNQVKRGFGREYIYKNEVLSNPRGKINITDSIKNNTKVNNKLSCDFDELSANVRINQILKSTAILLLKSKDVSFNRKKELKKVLIYFDSVEQIPLTEVNWNHIQYHSNNATYKMLINICYLVVNGLLLSESSEDVLIKQFFDDQKMHSLYEHFVLEYFKKHYPQLNVSAPYVKWNTNDDIVRFLPIMKTDITLEYKGKVLIIDTKYYQHSMQIREKYGSQTVHSNNIYQIFTYVKNKDVEQSGDVCGMLLYAKTDESMSPDFRYQMSGNTIWVKTLDLNQKFINISNQLDGIVSDWFPDGNIIRYNE